MKYNYTQQRMSHASQQLRKAIQRKCLHLPACRLNKILESIDPNRRYFIQATTSPQKFLNIVTAETIQAEGTQFVSDTTPIYGTFSPGRFMNLQGNKTILSGSMDECIPAAALKSSYGNRFMENQSVLSYTLVIYEPAAHQCVMN